MSNNKPFKVKNGLRAKQYSQQTKNSNKVEVGYSLRDAFKESPYYDHSAEDGVCHGLFFKPDGTTLYITGQQTDRIYQYDLSTPWDLNTITLTKSTDISTYSGGPEGIKFKSDGTKIAIIGNDSNFIAIYNLPTPWDIGTLNYQHGYITTSQDTQPQGLEFNSDGTKMFVVGEDTETIYQYSLSIGWSFAGTENQTLSKPTLTEAPFETFPRDMFFNDDGTKMFLLGSAADKVYQYDLGTPYNLGSDCVYSNISFDVSVRDAIGVESEVRGLYIRPDGSKFYVLGRDNDIIYQYSMLGYNETIDLSAGTYFICNLSGGSEIFFTNPPESGKAVAFSIEVNGNYNLTWPSGIKWSGGAAPDQEAETELYSFITIDGGQTYYGKKTAGDVA